jgi:hypothetical protein
MNATSRYAWELEAEGYNVIVQAWDFTAGRDRAHLIVSIEAASPDALFMVMDPTRWESHPLSIKVVLAMRSALCLALAIQRSAVRCSTTVAISPTPSLLVPCRTRSLSHSASRRRNTKRK